MECLAVSLQMLNVAIAGHNLTGVQVSGTDVEPIENIQNFNIGSGTFFFHLLACSLKFGERLVYLKSRRSLTQFHFYPLWHSGCLTQQDNAMAFY